MFQNNQREFNRELNQRGKRCEDEKLVGEEANNLRRVLRISQ